VTLRSTLRSLFICGLILGCALPCIGQTSTSLLSGTVFDHSGAVVAGAVVTVVNEATGVTLKQTTNSTGLYAFPSIPVGAYTVTVEAAGFKTANQTGNKLVVGTPLTVNITLEIGSATEVVKVEASVEQINTTNATLGNVVERHTVTTLPLNGRNPLNLIVLEPGVTQRSGTTINVNGMRSQAGNVTIDGIEANEASNPTPTNNVFRVNPDNVEEFKVTTSNPTPEEGKNSGLNVSIATRSGTNQFHGSLVEYFRNNDLNSNEFYANAQGQPRANLKSNQYGWEAGGPIRKNKTFFYSAWQGQKVNLSQAIDKAFGSVPRVYTPEALSGVFRYFVSNPASPLTLNGVKITQNSPSLVTSTGALAPGVRNCVDSTDLNCVQSYNIFANDPAHIGGDPAVLKLLKSYPAPNSFASGDGLNQAGYLWNAPSSVRGPRNLLRIDHTLNSNNNIFFRAMWATEQQLQGDLLNGRPAIFPGFPPRGEVYRPAHNFAFSWRSVIKPTLVNEFTAGFARFMFLFTYGDSNPNFPKNIPAYTFNNVDVDYIFSPHSKRTLNTPQLIDNLSWTKGAHVIKFGGNMRLYQQNDESGSVAGINVLPSISLSATLNPPGSAFNLPSIANGSAAGISSVDSSRLLSAVNDLLGIPATLKQGFLGNFNTNSFSPLQSGDYLSVWHPGERAKQFNLFAQDEWRARKNLTVTYGVRWEYNRPATEVSENPYVPDKAVDGSQGPVSFVKTNSWWKRGNADAFAPRVGIGWSPDGGRKTVIHGGYGIAFDSIPTYSAAAAANSVPGLAYSCTATTYGVASTPGCGTVPSNTRLSQGFPQTLSLPTVQPSSFLSPPAQLLGTAPNIVVFDPDFKTATVHQWNVTIQRELPGGFVIQTGYIGNRGERLYSQTDANQISAKPILDSFAAMQSNLAKGCKPDGSGCATGVVSTPVPLVTSGTITSTFANSSTTITDLQQNAAGNFAGRIEQTTLAAHLRPNQQFSSIILLSNKADSIFHSWQTTIRKRFAAGFLMNFAYTFGKVIDVQSGDPVGTSYGPTTSTASDSTNLRLDRGRADFDQTHVATVTWIYELPFGKGRPLMKSAGRLVDALFGGWSLQGFNSVMSGEPFSISSGAKTAQYGANSRAVIVGSTLPDDTLQTAALGPVFFKNASSFALAAAGSTGMGRNMFQGPSFWDMDGALSKSFQATERVKVTFRAEAFNALNHANFRKLGSTSVGSTSILSANFGTACCQTQSTSTSTAIVSNGEAYRVVQFLLKMTF
jgi:Carboxypeptidase regulatory-like domain/TonB dependent receptor